jgi:hypothetical protein
MKESHPAELFPGIVSLLQGGLGALDEPVKSGINGRHQQFVLVFEVKVNGAIRHAGPIGDFGHTGMEKAVLGDDLNGGIQYALVLA